MIRIGKIAVLCMATLLLVITTPHQISAGNCTASTSCSHGSANCDRNCPAGTVCISSCICTAVTVSCRCTCFIVSLEPDFGDPTDTVVPRTVDGITFSMADDVTVEAVGILIHDAGWGVVIVGDEDTFVGAGTYSGTLTAVVDDIGDDNTFSASWNDTTEVVTLTID